MLNERVRIWDSHCSSDVVVTVATGGGESELVVQSLCSGHKDIRQVKRSRSASTISAAAVGAAAVGAAAVGAATIRAAVSRDKVVLKVVDVDTVTHPEGGEAFASTTMAGDFDIDWILIGPDNE